MGNTWIIKLLKSVCACGCVRARLRCVWNCLCVCVPCICKRLNVSVCLHVRPWVYQHSQFRGCVVASLAIKRRRRISIFCLAIMAHQTLVFFAAPSLSQNWRPSTLATTPARPATRLPDTRNPPPSLSTVRIIIWLMLLLRWWLQHDGRASAARSWSGGFAVPPDWLLFLFLNYVSWNRSLTEVQHYWFSNHECLIVLRGVKQSYYAHNIACCIGSQKKICLGLG